MVVVKTNLNVKDFASYYSKNQLGKLYLPNGGCFDNLTEGIIFSAEEGNQLNINLKDLYELINNWKIKSKQVPFDNIISIIAYGSAVKFPGHELLANSKNPRPIQPKDVDFFVLTENNLTDHRYIKPGLFSNWHFSNHKKHKKLLMPNPYDPSSADFTAKVNKVGINVVNRGVNQLLEGIVNGDTISISALKEGIPVFYDEIALNKIYERSGIKKETPRELYWDDSWKLTGRIE